MLIIRKKIDETIVVGDLLYSFVLAIFRFVQVVDVDFCVLCHKG